jgi:uncharacterized surface protein with fasciclin (FAS1) repeats
MMRVLPKTLWLFAATSTLLTTQINAYCARCMKIEEERAKEKAAHPQPWTYYDDQIGLHSASKGEPTNADTNKGEATRDQDAESADKEKDELPSSSQSEQLSFLAAFYLAQSQENWQNGNQNSRNSSTNINPFEEDDVSKREKELLQPNSKTPSADDRTGYFGGGMSSTSTVSPSYSTLFTILKTKDFLETLDGSFTLFVPSNEALRKLPPGTLTELIKPENREKLATLVSNHVVARKMLRKDFEAYNEQEIKAISGRNLTVRFQKGNLSVDDAQILRIEPAGYDGVIYIIDKVLIPKNFISLDEREGNK